MSDIIRTATPAVPQYIDRLMATRRNRDRRVRQARHVALQDTLSAALIRKTPVRRSGPSLF
ncbi:MAG: hypothetical protein WBR15_01010 [Gammaproteobacteria bacterium]